MDKRNDRKNNNMMKIPLYQPSLQGNEKKYVNECLDSTWISSKGEYVERFEDAFAQYTNVRHAAAVTNGTAALHVALLALDIGPGDEVIVPTLTYIASVNAITYTGATPVFVDSRPETWQMDPADVARKISPKTRAIVAVHLYGHPCDMEALNDIVRRHRLQLIEDCAEAFGSRYNGTHVGAFGNVAAYSFYGNKTITTGEGGMVVTNDEAIHRKIVHLKGQGLAAHREYWHDVIGYNYRMTNICAAIGLAQLEQADTLLHKKRAIAEYYREHLQGLPVTFHGEIGDVYHSYWMCSVLTKTPQVRNELRNCLANQGIETRPLFCPVHTMPMYQAKSQRYRVAEDLSGRGMNLPSWPDLQEEQLCAVVDAIKSYY